MVTGAQSEDAALRAARLLVKMLQAIFSPSSSSKGPSSSLLPALSDSQEGGLERKGVVAGGTEKEGCVVGMNDKEKTLLAIDDGATEETRPRAASTTEGAERERDREGGALVAVAAKDTSPSSPPPGALSKRNYSNIRLTEFAVENIVATADCGLPVRLEGLAFDHKEFCSYEPELFAG